MAKKRKRSQTQSLEDHEAARKRINSNVDLLNLHTVVKHATLSVYYPRVLTLREYFLSKLPISSKSRRRKIAAIKYTAAGRPNSEQAVQAVTKRHDQENKLAELLDSTFVGVTLAHPSDVAHSRTQDFVSFSQQVKLTADSSIGEALTSQTEVGLCFDFVFALRDGSWLS